VTREMSRASGGTQLATSEKRGTTSGDGSYGACVGGDESRRAAFRVRFTAECEEAVELLPDVGSRVERFGREWVAADPHHPRKFEDSRVELREPGLGPPHDPDEPRRGGP
jgi:hypothetical protein